MNSGWRLKRSFIGQINDFWTSVTNVFPQNRTFWRLYAQNVAHVCLQHQNKKKENWLGPVPFWQITGPFPLKQCISCSTDGPFPKKFLKIN
jgi:hypothetical protein